MDEMLELAGFYEARLDEEQARAAARPPVVVVGEADIGAVDGRTGQPARGAAYGYAWDPDRSRRDVDAKRALLARYRALSSPRTLADRVLFPSLAGLLAAVIRDFAAAWSDHQDYKEAWKP